MTPIQRLLLSRLQGDPATSRWLLDAVQSSFRRDPVDALADAEALVDVLTRHLNQVFAADRARAVAPSAAAFAPNAARE
jgi:hypothetical protein